METEEHNGKWLIVNADDFGRTSGISQGICSAHKDGIVTSTSVMINLPNAVEDVAFLLSNYPELGIGVHLNLTCGSPISDPSRIPSLLDSSNAFPQVETVVYAIDRLDPDEVKREWRSQIDLLLELSADIDHLDSHHHIAALRPHLWNVLLELAKEYSIAVRHPCPSPHAPSSILQKIPKDIREFPCHGAIERLGVDRVHAPDSFIASFFAEEATVKDLINLLNSLPPGVHELMTHPGFADQPLMEQSTYNLQREDEIRILTNPLVFETLQHNSIQLTPYKKLLDG
jgi:predicted glycoside hydrolase/deacetylase ChbG (UPF0249 family)